MTGDKRVAVITNKGTVVADAIMSKYAVKEGEHSRAMPVDVFSAKYYEKGLVVPLYTLETLAALPEVNTFHAKCIEAVSHDSAGLGWGLEPVEAGDEKKTEEDGKAKQLKQFFETCNDEKTIEELLTALVYDLRAEGGGYLELIRENYRFDGVPVQLNQIPYHTVRIEKTMNKYAQVRMNKKVWFKRFGYDKDVKWEDGSEHELGSLPEDEVATELIPLISYGARSDYYGLPPIMPALGALEGYLSLRDYNISFFRNFGVPSYAIYISGDYNLGTKIDDDGKPEGDPDYDESTGEYPVLRSIKEHLNNIKLNPHSPLIVGIPSADPEGKVEVKFVPLATEVKEASFRLYRKDNRDEIIVAHQVPPYRIGIAETGSLGGSTAEESSEIYKDSTIAPVKKSVENLVNIYIIKQAFEITTWKFYLNELTLEDDKFRMELATFMFERGAMTPNEIIIAFGEEFNLKPVEDHPGMDWHYINWQPIEAGAILQDGMIESVKHLHDRLIEAVEKEEK